MFSKGECEASPVLHKLCWRRRLTLLPSSGYWYNSSWKHLASSTCLPLWGLEVPLEGQSFWGHSWHHGLGVMPLRSTCYEELISYYSFKMKWTRWKTGKKILFSMKFMPVNIGPQMFIIKFCVWVNFFSQHIKLTLTPFLCAFFPLFGSSPLSLSLIVPLNSSF